MSSNSRKKDRKRNRQYRNIQKRENKKIELIPKKLTASQLANQVSNFQPMVDEANARIEAIKEAGYTSMAVELVEYQTGKEYFDLFDVKNREDLISRMTAVRVFLSDKGSTLEGAKLETMETTTAYLKGKFGGQWKVKQNNDVSYDQSVIDEETAKRAFANYRRIEEVRASQIGRQGESGVYGSENLIIAMYDAEVRGVDSLEVGMDLLDAWYEEARKNWQPFIDEAGDTNSIKGYAQFLARNLTW